MYVTDDYIFIQDSANNLRLYTHPAFNGGDAQNTPNGLLSFDQSLDVKVAFSLAVNSRDTYKIVVGPNSSPNYFEIFIIFVTRAPDNTITDLTF